MRSGIQEAVETGKIRPEVREALPVSENDSIAAAQVRIWAENGRLNETIGLEQDIGTLAAEEQALCREVQEAVESGRVTAELREKLGLPGNDRAADRRRTGRAGERRAGKEGRVEQRRGAYR